MKRIRLAPFEAEEIKCKLEDLVGSDVVGFTWDDIQALRGKLQSGKMIEVTDAEFSLIREEANNSFDIADDNFHYDEFTRKNKTAGARLMKLRKLVAKLDRVK